jgi:hypothetical protein
MPKLQQALLVNWRVRRDRGRIEPYPLRRQVVNADNVLVQSYLKLAAELILSQLIEDPGQPIIAEIERADWPLEARRIHIQSLRHPILDVIETMVARTEDVDLPPDNDLSETKIAFPVRVLWRELV